MVKKTARQPLSRERVLAAAVALADEHGLAALTMRRLAVELGVEAMSLYYHLPDKETLLDGVADTVVAEVLAAVTQEPGGGSWREVLRRDFLTARRVMLRHPWAPGLLGTRRGIPMSVAVLYDRMLATLAGAGFSHRLAHRAVHAFGSLPLGFAQEVFSPAAAGGGMDAGATRAGLAAMAERLPHLTAMVEAEVHAAGDPTLGWCDSQVEFEFTLDLLLDGLERHRG